MADQIGSIREWQVPSQAAAEDRKLGWLNESTEEGQNWLRVQRGAGDWRKSLDLLAGRADATDRASYRSGLSANRLKRDVREVVGALANIRPIWGYHSDNRAFEKSSEMMNKVARAVYLESMFDRSIKEVLQYAAATCTGWARPVYQRDQGGRGKGSMKLLTYGAPCVLPVQLPSSNDWQQAYSVTLMDEMPIYMAHSYWPKYQERLLPTSSKYWYSQEIRTAAVGNMWQRVFTSWRRKPQNPQSDLFIPIRYTTVIDNTINTSGQMIPMGEPGSSWYYEVPAKGQDIPIGRDRQGNPIFRKATDDDARLYPYRRLMISSEAVVMYDGPAFNWHGELDLINFCVDDWAWEGIGFSLLHDGWDLQEAIDIIDQGVMTKIKAQLDPALGYDINSVTPKEAKQFDPFMPRQRVGYDGSAVDQPFVNIIPPESLRVEAEILANRQYLMDSMDYSLGVHDIVALGKARALGQGGEEAEALMVSEGPIVNDISRSMERGLSRIGSQLKYLILQYMTSQRVMQYVGEDGVSNEIFDYDPESLVPSHMPGEQAHDSQERPIGSLHSQMERARWFADNLRFMILPHSVHEITQMSRRLMLLQLKRAGAPLDWGTVFEACNVPDSKMEDGSSVQDRFWNEKEKELEQMFKASKIAAELGITPEMMQGPGQHGGGRRPTAQAAPKLVSKDGGARSTISESR